MENVMEMSWKNDSEKLCEPCINSMVGWPDLKSRNPRYSRDSNQGPLDPVASDIPLHHAADSQTACFSVSVVKHAHTVLIALITAGSYRITELAI